MHIHEGIALPFVIGFLLSVQIEQPGIIIMFYLNTITSPTLAA